MSQPNWHQAAPQYPPPPPVPAFRVSAMRHTGLLILWFNQTRTVTGTFAQCEAELRGAQQHNLVLGWWSLLSILIMNWVALLHNRSARTTLHQQAEQAQAYAQWWYQYGQHQSPPPQAQRN